MIRTIIAVLAVVLTLPLSAQLAAVESPRFFIERIEVRNAKRVSPDVVIAESRLREGREYSESELREASHRVNRLPFILAADFSLEKGSERGRHILVLNIAETKPFFFRLDARYYIDAEDNVRNDYRDSLTPSGDDLALGFRWFVGRRGAIHLGLQGENQDSFRHTRDDASFAVGYTQYDIFGTRAFATLNLRYGINEGRDELVPQLVVGIPLSLNQTVTVQYDRNTYENTTIITQVGESRVGFEQDIVRVRWSFNTTNDPVLPTEGMLLAVGPVVSRTEGRSIGGVVTGPTLLPYEQEAFGVEAHAARYWSLTDRDSVAAAVEAGWSTVDNSARFDHDEETYGAVQAGYSRSLWSPERRARGGDSRLEASARWSNDDLSDQFQPNFYDDNVLQLTTSWVRRSSWGTVRLGVGYAW